MRFVFLRSSFRAAKPGSACPATQRPETAATEFRRPVPRLLRTVGSAVFLALFVGAVPALELPAPEQLETRTGLQRRIIHVVEPHESTADRPVIVGYVGLPMATLLEHWFGDRWKAPDAEIAFFARDGYRSVVAGSKLREFQAYLAFGREDGSAFVVDNPSQNERRIPLGPYYLVWDNRAEPALLKQGAYGWPYQVMRIELRRTDEDRALLPRRSGPDLAQGFAAAREYCLTCHRLRGSGGEKYPEDLLQATCRWTKADLQSWIDDPGRVRPGTAMPAFNRGLPAAERRRTIESIVRYLGTLKEDDPGVCAVGRPRS